MDIVDAFDVTKYRLGKLCKKNHDWSSTGQTLRRLTTGVCAECDRASCKASYRKNREKRNEQSRIYRQENYEKCKEQRKRYREENREKVLEGKREFHCRNRDTILEKRRNDYQLNKEKYLARTTEWIKNNREWYRQYHRDYYRRYISTPEGKQNLKRREYKREALKRSNHSSPYTSLDLISRWQLFDNCCAYCGGKATSIDHFIPLSKGGGDVLSNLLPACQSCNSSKRDYDVEQWYKSYPSYTAKRWRKILKVLGLTESTLGQLSLF